MADTVIIAGIEINVEDAKKSVKGLKSELDDAKDILTFTVDVWGEFSKQAVEAAKRVKELEEPFNEVKTVSKIFAEEGAAGLNAFSETLKGVSAGFGALTGTMSLFGEKSEVVNGALEKVKAGLEITEGISAIGKLGEAFEALKVAIGATGIGLIVVALGTIYAYWDKIKSLLTGVNAKQQQAVDDAKAEVKAQQDKASLLDNEDNILKLRGLSEKQILQLKIKQAEAEITAMEGQLKAQKNLEDSQIKTAKRNQDILAGILNFITTPIRQMLEGVDAIGKFFGKDWNLAGKFQAKITSIAGYVFDADKIKKDSDEANKTTENGLLELKNKLAGFQLSVQQIDKTAANKRKDDDKKAADKRSEDDKRDFENRLQTQLDENKRLEELDIARAKSVGKSESDIEKIQLQYQQKKINTLSENYDQLKDKHSEEAVALQKQIAEENQNLLLMQLDNETKGYEELARLKAEQAAKEKKAKDEQNKNNIEERQKQIKEEFEDEKKRIANLQISEDLKKQLIEAYQKKMQDAENELAEEQAQKNKSVKDDVNNRIDKNAEGGKTEAQKKLEELQKFYDDRINIVKKGSEEEKLLISEYNKEKSAIERQALNQRLSTTAGVLGQLSNLFGKQTAAGKVAAIAEATINTYLAASKALTGIPKGNPFGATMAIIQAGIIIATGLKNVKEIAKTPVPGGGASSSVADASSPAAPLTPQIQQTSTQLNQDQLNQIGNATVRAFVLESDVSNNQEKIARLNRAARLGG